MADTLNESETRDSTTGPNPALRAMSAIMALALFVSVCAMFGLGFTRQPVGFGIALCMVLLALGCTTNVRNRNDNPSLFGVFSLILGTVIIAFFVFILIRFGNGMAK